MEHINLLPYENLRECCNHTYNNLFQCKSYVQVCYDTYYDKSVWHAQRKYRISGSRCYELYTYAKECWKEKVKKYYNPVEFTSKYTSHGIKFENEARNLYKNLYSDIVVDIGFVVSKQNLWLGCSPDGVILNKDQVPYKLLEIKCPYKGIYLNVVVIISKC